MRTEGIAPPWLQTTVTPGLSRGASRRSTRASPASGSAPKPSSPSSGAGPMSSPRSSARGSTVCRQRTGGADRISVGPKAGSTRASRWACAEPALVQRPQVVGSVPVRPAPGPGVPDEEQRGHGRDIGADQVREDGAVPLVRAELRGRGDREPAQLVDLVVGLEVAAEGLHHPVVDPLEPLDDGIGGLHAPAAGDDRQPGLLADLADRRGQPVLARVELPLGQRPVVVAGAVDEDDLDAAVRRVPPDGATGRGDDVPTGGRQAVSSPTRSSISAW